MHISAIIAEFNPFHNGHRHLIEQAKQAGADACLVVMSGDFVQRGEPALLDKYARTRMALQNGADLVIELPVLSATASAEGFAGGAISLIDALGAVDSLVFGCEDADLELLTEITALLLDAPADFENEIKEACAAGLSYPAARAAAIRRRLPNVSDTLLNSPNNILAIEYLKSLLSNGSHIRPIAIARIGADHRDQKLYEGFSSASALRKALRQGQDVAGAVPATACEILKSYEQQRGFLFEEDIFSLLLPKLLQQDAESLSLYGDCNPFLANRIKNCCFDVRDYADLLARLSSKDYTLSRIKRVLIHILLEIHRGKFSTGSRIDYRAFYGRVLGCKDKTLLSLLSKQARIPLITRLSAQMPALEPAAAERLQKDLDAAHLYESLVCAKYGCPPMNEYKRPLIV